MIRASFVEAVNRATHPAKQMVKPQSAAAAAHPFGRSPGRLGGGDASLPPVIKRAGELRVV